ncbi:MAG: ATP-binding cassette domain-containing protein [Amylibacter sp.]|nr:ATP-binding cassette domain-containing protein [Amylibacter sp.]
MGRFITVIYPDTASQQTSGINLLTNNLEISTINGYEELIPDEENEGGSSLSLSTADDTYVGNVDNEIIYAGDGDDDVSGNLGNDELFGENGNDTLNGNEGDDILNGGSGNDILLGGDGDDLLIGKAKREKVAEILRLVELPVEFENRYATELSGGQKQRINLARSLAAMPELMLCDEVTSALDSIVASNVVKLLKRLRDLTGVSFMFITHDLSTVASFADEIVVLYAGRIVEQGPVDEVLSPPFHPYTRLLISSVPEMRIGWLEETMKKREMAVGIARGVEITAVGCPFFNRCPIAISGTCERVTAPTYELKEGHFISCHHSAKEIEAIEKAPQQVLHGFEKVIPDDEIVIVAE